MDKQLTKLKIYPHRIPKVCPFCLVNQSLGFTSYGIVGCRFCQTPFDKWVADNFIVVKEA